jgi:chromosome segregation ATPase
MSETWDKEYRDSHAGMNLDCNLAAWQYIKELEASNKALTEKLAAAEAEKQALWRTIDHANNQITEDEATIESLNLRVARLVDALTKSADLADTLVESMDYLGTGSNSKAANKEREEDRAVVVRLREALTAEQDNEWLREHDAKVLEDAADDIESHCAGERWAIFEIRAKASELRQPKKSPDNR